MNLFDKVKSEVKKMKEDKAVPVPISSNMLNELIKKTDKVKDTTVEITNGVMIIKGTAEVEKMMIKKDISFSIILQPIKMEKREIIFKIEKFKPLNLTFLNKKIFNKSPYLTYEAEQIKIDFNSWEMVQKIPFGNIKKYELKEGKIVLSIGI